MSESWLALTIEQINNVSNIIDPGTKVKPGEEIVGKLEDEFLQKLYSLAMELCKGAELTRVRAGFEHNDEKRKKVMATALALKKKSEVLMEVFWICINDKFNLWGCSAIGIREGFTVVTFESFPPSFEDLLRIS